MNKEAQRLKRLRDRIDALDRRIQALIADRARCALAIGRAKHDDGAAHVYRPEREAEVLRAALARNDGPLADADVTRLFREIISACRALEVGLRVAFLGPEGTFTHEATLKHFGQAVTTIPLGAIDEVFREVESGNAHFGVVPIENSTEGVVNHTLDTFLVSSLKICGEIQLRVHHHLLGRGPVGHATRVLSHQQSLAQCREWLDANLPNIERVAVSSNAEAARRAAAEPDTLAIAGDSAARIYGLDVRTANIEDRPDNTTRFLVIGDLETEPTGADRSSFLLSSRNRPGSLHHLLAPLARHRVNMTRIESRPSRQSLWEYVFFVDVEGHVRDRKVAKVVAELKQEAALFRHLGSYPKAVL